MLIRQRTRIINALRAHLAELGIVAAQGDAGLTGLLAIVADEQDTRLPIDARASVMVLAAQLGALRTLIGSLEKRIMTQHRSNDVGAPGQTGLKEHAKCVWGMQDCRAVQTSVQRERFDDWRRPGIAETGVGSSPTSITIYR